MVKPDLFFLEQNSQPWGGRTARGQAVGAAGALQCRRQLEQGAWEVCVGLVGPGRALPWASGAWGAVLVLSHSVFSQTVFPSHRSVLPKAAYLGFPKRIVVRAACVQGPRPRAALVWQLPDACLLRHTGECGLPCWTQWLFPGVSPPDTSLENALHHSRHPSLRTSELDGA